MTTVAIDHINITAPQQTIDKVVAFYVDILGLQQGHRPDFGVPGYWLYCAGRPIVHLLVGEQKNGDNGYFDHIAFRCTDIDAIKNTLNDHGVVFSIFSMDDLNQTQLFLTDPAGIKVELNFAGRC